MKTRQEIEAKRDFIITQLTGEYRHQAYATLMMLQWVLAPSELPAAPTPYVPRQRLIEGIHIVQGAIPASECVL